MKFVPAVALLWNLLFFSQERHLLPEDFTDLFTNLFGFTNYYRDIFIFYAWFFDYAAWLAVILGLAYLWTGITKRLGKLDYLVMPLIFTLLSFVYYRPCGGWICFMSGNGFPLPYYNETLNWWAFLIDAAVWALIIYPLIKLFIKKGVMRHTVNDAKEISGESIKPSKLNRMANSKKLILILAGFFGIEAAFGAIRMIAFNDFTSFRFFNATDTFIPWIALLVEFILSIMGIIAALFLFRKTGNYLPLAAAMILAVFFLIMLYDIAIYLPLMFAIMLFPHS